MFGLWMPELFDFDPKIGFLVKNCIFSRLELFFLCFSPSFLVFLFGGPSRTRVPRTRENYHLTCKRKRALRTREIDTSSFFEGNGEYAQEKFPRCAKLFLKNSLATMDGIIWICKVSKSSTLARLIITYLYFLQNVNIFMFRKISGESIFEIYPNKSGRPKFIFISTLWKKISCWKHFGMLGFSNKNVFHIMKAFSVL